MFNFCVYLARSSGKVGTVPAKCKYSFYLQEMLKKINEKVVHATGFKVESRLF